MCNFQLSISLFHDKRYNTAGIFGGGKSKHFKISKNKFIQNNRGKRKSLTLKNGRHNIIT